MRPSQFCLAVWCMAAVTSAAFSQDTQEQQQQKKLAKERKQIEQQKDDVFDELDHQNLTLRFFNALTGAGIPGATVTINNVEYNSDEEGKVQFPAPDSDGIYPVAFRAPKYVPVDFTVEIMAGTLFFNRFSISPLLDVKFLRVVLDWDAAPPDLDATSSSRGHSTSPIAICERPRMVPASLTAMLQTGTGRKPLH